MGARIALCVDELTARNPELMGLDGEMLERQGWLGVLLPEMHPGAGFDAVAGIDVRTKHLERRRVPASMYGAKAREIQEQRERAEPCHALPVQRGVFACLW